MNNHESVMYMTNQNVKPTHIGLIQDKSLVLTIELNNNIIKRLTPLGLNETTLVLFDVTGYKIPDNLKELLEHRYICIREGYTEDPAYVNNSDILRLLTCRSPTVVNTGDHLVLDESFRGTYDIPKGTVSFTNNSHKQHALTKLKGFTGSATYMYLQGSGVRKAYLHKSTKYADFTDCENLRHITINDEMSTLNLRSTGLTNRFELKYHVKTLNLWGTNITSVSVLADELILTHSNIHGVLELNNLVNVLDVSHCSHITKVNGMYKLMLAEASGLCGNVFTHRCTMIIDIRRCNGVTEVFHDRSPFIMLDKRITNKPCIVLMSDGEVIHRFRITQTMHARMMYQTATLHALYKKAGIELYDLYSEPESDIIFDVTDYDVPDNIDELITNRRTYVTSRHEEDIEYRHNRVLLNLLGCGDPYVV